ncbi:hypothetical protein N7488_000653 [Penicillium malachiteum]|nr:hypothetical protein N7488_000653 [Penicillium malachiteum]
MAVNPSTVAEELFWIYPGYGEPTCRPCLRAVERIEVQDHLTGPLHRMPLAEALPVARAVYERWCSSYTGAGSYSSVSQNPGSDGGSDCEDDLDWLNTLEEESQPDECAPPDPPRPKRDWRGSIFPANRTDPLIPDRIKSILEFHTFGENIWESSMARMGLENGLTYWPNRCWPCMSRGNQANCMHTLNDCKLPDEVIGKAKKWFHHACGKLPHDLRCSYDCDRYQSPDQPEGARPCSHIEHMLALIATFLFSDPAVGKGIEPERCEKIQIAGAILSCNGNLATYRRTGTK